MELLPQLPPGSAQRKLRAFLVEIGRLRNEGYTITVILEALKTRGVSVSWSTVQRETKRSESVRFKAAPVTVKRPAPLPWCRRLCVAARSVDRCQANFLRVAWPPPAIRPCTRAVGVPVRICPHRPGCETCPLQ